VILFALVRHTIRELLFRVTLLILTGISTLIILVMLLSVGSAESAEGVVITLFSQAMGPPVPIDQLEQAAYLMQMSLTGGLYTGIILFGIIATAGLIPETLEKGLIDIYLSKPLARWQLIIGRILGAVAIIFANALYFLGALWLIFGLKLGVWNAHFLIAPFILTLVFACLYTISVLIGILVRNAVVPILGVLFYQVVVAGLLESRERSLYLLSQNVVYRTIVDGFYYALPQIRALQASNEQFIIHQSFMWEPLVQSIAVSGLILGASLWVFQRKDF